MNTASSRKTPAYAILHLGYREVWRGRVLWVVSLTVICIYLLAEFVTSLAITDSPAYRIVVYVSCIRLALGLVLSIHVGTVVMRERSERLRDYLLAQPIAIESWYIGRLFALFILAIVTVAAAALPLLMHAPTTGTALWALSLLCELMIIIAVTFAAACVLRTALSAIVAAMAFYCFARIIGVLVLMSRSKTIDQIGFSDQLSATLLAMLAHLVPDLSRFASHSWLLKPAATGQIFDIIVSTVLLVALLTVIGIFDVYRDARSG